MVRDAGILQGCTDKTDGGNYPFCPLNDRYYSAGLLFVMQVIVIFF